MDHSMILAATSSLGVGDTSLGTIELPQRDSGTWKIHQVFGQVVRTAATAAESVGGSFRLQPNQGEVLPNPAPSRFPIFEAGSFLGSTAPVSICALHRYNVDYDATGQARIEIIYDNAIAATADAEVVAGIIFGDERPVPTPFHFVDRCRSAIKGAADAAIGTITLSQNATKIVGVLGVLQQDGVLTTAETLIGHFRMASDDVKMVPAQFPFNAAFGAGVGILIGGGDQPKLEFIPVDIPVAKGARIDCFCNLNVAVSHEADVEIFLAYV